MSNLEQHLAEVARDLAAAMREAVRQAMREAPVRDDGTGGRELLTLKEAAGLAGLSLTTIKVRIKTGHLRALKSGRALRVRQVDVLALFEAPHEVRSAEEQAERLSRRRSA